MEYWQCAAIVGAVLLAGDRVAGQVYHARREASEHSDHWSDWETLTTDEALDQADKLLIEARRRG